MRQPDPAPTDADLVRAHQRGDATAFAALVQRYHQELYHFLARFVGNRTAAEDIFQEAFLQVHVSIDSFDLTRPFKPWLFTIAANKARDYLRRQNRMQPQVTVLPDNEGEGDRTVVDLMDGELPQPEELAANQELRADVRDVVAGLPEHLREILLLAYFHQIPYKDIAKALGIPLGTVKSRLHAAVGSFAQAWREKTGDQNPRSSKNQD